MAEGEEGSVGAAVAAFKLVLENIWTIGTLVSVFCALALWAPHFGLVLNEAVKQWVGAGLLFGTSCIVVSILIAIINLLKANGQAFTAARKKLAEDSARDEDTIANLQTLSDNEIWILYRLLLSGLDRHEVNFQNPAYGLVAKDILRRKAKTSIDCVLCALSPAIIDIRDYLLRDYEELMRQHPQRFREGAHFLQAKDGKSAVLAHDPD